MRESNLLFENQQLTVGSSSSSLTKPLFAAQQLMAESGSAQRANPTHVAINPLVAAASSLLTLSTQLSGQTTSPNLKQLLDKLSAEVKLFENKVHALGYRAPIILAARYFLCALLDETILHTDWGKDSTWQEHNLLQTFQREGSGSDRFFLILERSSEDPKLHIDLLELGYLCLSLGFEGKYRKKEHDSAELRHIIDNVYHLIRYVRGDFSKRLVVSSKAPASTQSDQKSKKMTLRFPPAWLATAVSLVALAGIYLPYQIHLAKLAAPVSKMIQDVPLSTEAMVDTETH